MGEGEVCVAVVSNVGEMENGKSQQKRDHCWLTGESDAEPLAKKQAVEGLVEDGIRVELCVQQNTKESLDGLELEHFDRSVTTEARNGSTPDSSDEDLIQQCFNAAKQQILGSKQAVECLDYVGLTSEQSVKEGSCDMELDSSGEKHSLEVLTDMEIEPVVEQPVKECLNEVGLESHGRMQTTGDKSDIERELSIEQSVKECASEIETEACGKKQPAVIMNGSDQEHSVQKPVEECGSEIETEERVRIQPTEILNESEPECSVQKPVEECGTEIETEACGKIQPTEILNESEPERSVQKPIEECGSEIDTEACGKMQPIEVLNESVSEPSVQEPVTKCPSEMEMEVCGKILVTEVMNEREPESSVQKPVKECEIEIDAEACGKLQPTEVLYENESESKPFIQELVSECPSEIEMEACGKIQPTEVLNKSEPEPFIQNSVKECQSEMELEVCGRKQTTQDLCNTGIESSVGKQTTDALNGIELGLSVDQSVKEGQNEIVIDPCTKKEASNDDICSEVSNPNVSPRDNSPSFQTVTSQPDGKVVTKEQVVCGEITSTCSRNSSSEGSSSQEENGTNDTTTSNVVLEVPKDASTSSGVRKITFKFSKRKEDDDSQMSASDAKCMGYPYSNRTRKVPRSTHISEQGLHEYGDSLLHPTTKELMNGKGVPDGYPTTVKRLLSTRILDGAKVKYISSSGELIGIVKDCGYLCGCDACNFSIVLRAHEFEEHAGGKTKHPNNHIYLENGKPIYSIIQAMKAASLGTVDEAIKEVAGSSVNEELLQVWKASLQRNTNRAKTDNSHHMKLMNLYHSTTSYTSQSREDVSIPYHCYRKSFSFEPHALVNETMRERNRLFKKPKSLAVSTGVEIKRSADGGHKKRDNDLHRLLFMPNGLPDGTELAYYARGKKILEGYKQGNGIVCSHCDTEISPSQFEAHAGWAAKRQPYRHIYIPNGLTLHDIALLLANGQSIATSNSDDMCAVCGDRGELVICDGCPRAFHAACLGLEGVPSDDWHCPTCRDSIGSVRKAAAESRPIVIRLTRVVKAREYETGGCVICRAPDFSVAEFDDRTVMLCDQCEKEYHVGCLREGGICDLKALPSDKWFCCNHCDMIHGAIQDVVTNGAGVIPGSALSTINRKHIEKGVIGGAPNDIRWRMLSGKSRYPEHLPLLSTAAAIFRECFDPIVALSGRDLIPVMVYGRNISGQEFGGIYCVVLMVGSVVVSAGLLRVFGQEVAELPLVATSRQHQGKGYFQALFICIEDLLLSLGVKLLVLPAAEEALSIWTKKFGFTKMSDQQYTQYARDIQLTIFKGTTMLEKVLHPKDNR